MKLSWWNLHWCDLYYKIKCFFRPKQKWLIKKIPNRWVDKDTLLEICVLESLKHFVEKEEGLEGLKEAQNDLNYSKEQREHEAKLLAMYHLATATLPYLNEQLNQEWDKVEVLTLDQINTSTKEDYERRYGKIDRLEEEIYNLKTKIMAWVIENRGSLWT